MEFKMLNPNEVKLNLYNPNEMIGSVFNHLKDEIQRVGFIDPILARKEGESLIVIDGEHRLKASQELGLKEVPVVIVEMDEDTAKIQTVNSNLIKGEFNPVKFAKLLKDLEVKFDKVALQKY